MERLSKLEAVRGFAALYVVLHHLGGYASPAWGGPFLLLRFGREAVILFFVLSGFVIEYATPQELPFADYLRKRFFRIFPLFLASLLLAYVADSWQARSLLPVGGWELAGNLAMVQGQACMFPGQWVEPFHSNGPLWSLTFEWWFYMAYFPLRKYVPSSLQRWAAAALAVLGWLSFCIHPNPLSAVASFFVIWWCGVEFAREFRRTGRVTARAQLVPLGAVLLVGGLWTCTMLRALPAHPQVGTYPVLPVRLFGAALAILLGALVWQRLGFAGFGAVLGPFRWIAPFSYGLYVTHMPLLVSGAFEALPSRPLRWCLFLAAALTLGWFLERRVAPRLVPRRPRGSRLSPVLPAQPDGAG